MLSHNWRINAAAVAILAVVAAANAGERSPAPARIVTSKGKAVEIVAHRGASYDAPENTLASLRLAWRQNADASEFDVFQTKDGRLVVLHDKDTKRTAPGQANLVVAETPFDRLRTLDVGAWKNAKFKGEKIPTLAEMIGATPAGKRLFIEIKAGSEAVPELDRVLRDSKIDPAMTPIISFHSNVIAAVKARRPELPAFWIASLNPKNPPTAKQLIATARKIKADGLDLQATDVLDEAFAKEVTDAGLRLFVWTVNDVSVARRMLSLGVEGITTDRPGWLRDELTKN